MRVGLIIILIFNFILSVKSQLIINSNCQAFTENNYFNQEFIKKNKIHFINGKTSTKKENDIIRETDLAQLFEFDTEGRLIKQMFAHHANGYRTDTTTIMYYYDDKGRLVTKRQNDAYSFYSYNYIYDSLGNVIKETYSRDENCGPSKYDFKLGVQYEIISESYSYIIHPEKKVKKYFNNYGKEYQEREFYYSSLNYLLEERMFYSLTGRQTMDIKYEYDEKGFIIARTENSFEGQKKTTTYGYDVLGNLIEYDYFADESQTIHREILYEKQTMFVSATITKEIRSSIISIVKFNYDFYY